MKSRRIIDERAVLGKHLRYAAFRRKDSHMFGRRAVRALIVTVTLVTAAGMTGPAGAQTSGCTVNSSQYPPAAGALQVSDGEVTAGQTITVQGCGFAAGASVRVALGTVVLSTVLADATGGIETSVTIPASTAPGTHTLTATGQNSAGGTLVLSANVEVLGGGSDLPRTGSSSTTPLAAAGVGLVLLGGAAVVVARRRRTSRVAA